MSDKPAVHIDPVVSAFMQAQDPAGRMQCLVQVRLDDITRPAAVDNSRVGQVAPAGYTIMPKVGQSVHDTHEAGSRERDLYQRLQDQGGMGIGHRRALFASGLDVSLTAKELSVVASWNGLVGAITPSTGRYVLVEVPGHWKKPAPAV